jgi:hypothetical protein
MAHGNILGADARPRFFPVATAPFELPFDRLGVAVRVAGRSLSVMQKEAVVVSSTSG